MKGFVALEDVSIVVPMAVAIVLFFAALAWALNTIQGTNTSVDLTLKIVDLADVFTSPGVVTAESFDQSCKSATALMSGYGYLVYITSPDSPKSIGDAFSGGPICSSVLSADQIPKHATVVTRAFPIPFQTTRNGLPFNEVNLLVVSVWREG